MQRVLLRGGHVEREELGGARAMTPEERADIFADIVARAVMRALEEVMAEISI